jgi:hypothetical protein
MQQQARVVIQSQMGGGRCASSAETKKYADECWAAQPEISPDSWRVWEGLTLGKVTPLISAGTMQEDLDFFYANGMNGWLVTPGGIESVQGWVQSQAQDVRSRVVLVGLWPWRNGTDVPSIDPVVWDAVMLVWPEESPDMAALLHAFSQLEVAVRNGVLPFYGFAAEGWKLKESALHFLSAGDVLARAREAAQQAWGRRKRPALRLAGVPINLLELGALHHDNTALQNPGGEEKAPVLEVLARAGIGVIALRPLCAFYEGKEIVLNAAMAETTLGRNLATTLLTRLPKGWAQLTLPQAALQIVANIPGVTAVTLEPTQGVHASEVPEIFHYSGHPDIAAVIGWVR